MYLIIVPPITFKGRDSHCESKCSNFNVATSGTTNLH